MQLTESRLQQECFMQFHNTYPKHRGLFFKIKNEGTNRITGARDKANGLVAGVADSCLVVPFSPVCFIEFKTETGRQSQKQKEFEKTVKEAGHEYVIIRTVGEFKALIQYKLELK